MTPYKLDVLMEHSVGTNVLLILLCLANYFLVDLYPAYTLSAHDLYHDGWSQLAIWTNMFLHADPIHLLGNMYMLWLFGNAICGKIGGFYYLGLFFGFGMCSTIAHVLWDGDPLVGASGAISGILGFYLVLYPRNKIRVFRFISFQFITFEISSFWIISLWVGENILGLYTSTELISFSGHLGGFTAGFISGLLALYWRLLKMDALDLPTLLDIVQGKGRRRIGTLD